MWLHCSLVQGHSIFAWKRVVKKFSNDCTIRASQRGRTWSEYDHSKRGRRKREGNALLLKFFFFMTLHKVPYKCKLFFFAPLFRQSNVQNGEKLVYWSIWTTFWPAAASLENWQIKLILQHCISASLAHTQKVLLKLARVPKKITLQSFFHCHF